jgi:hypothetical protein
MFWYVSMQMLIIQECLYLTNNTSAAEKCKEQKLLWELA